MRNQILCTGVLAVALAGAAAAQVTPPPLRSVNSDKSLWTATGIHVASDGGNLSGGAFGYELGHGKWALLFGGSMLSGSSESDGGGFASSTIDSTSLIFNTGMKFTLRPSRVYADDGTVVDAQVGAAAYATATSGLFESESETCFRPAPNAPETCRTDTIEDTHYFSIAGAMVDVPLGRRMSLRPHAGIPLGLENAEPFYGLDLAILGGLEDSWEISLSSVIQASEDDDSDVYTFTFTRKL
jgi:hypothetical protein